MANISKITIFVFIFSEYLTSSFKISLNRKNLQEIPIGEINMGVSNLELKYNELTGLENRTFENHANIIKLNLWSNKIAYISSGAFHGISNLQTLDLGRNTLTEMPDLTLVSSSLTYLSLKENDITSKNLSAIVMEKLVTLHLGMNKITYLSTNSLRYVMPKLKILNLNSNKITGITSEYFSQFGYLEKLYISSNRLTELNPVDLNISNSLTRLEVDHNNIAMLENGSFKGFTKFNVLKMSYNSITEFDAAQISSGQGLPGLLHLHLFGNDLTNMPCTDLLPSQMETLDVGGNEITYIPDGYFSSFQNLTSLNLDGMAMVNLPDFTTVMQYLEELVLSNNDFVQLNLSRNFFMSVPVLKKLDLRYNSLTILNEGSLCVENITMTNLEELDLRDNEISVVCENYFCLIPKLKILRLANNRLGQFTLSTDLEQIEEIKLSHNDLTEFPKLGSAIRNIRKLYLSNNNLQNITLNSMYGSDTPLLTATSLILLNINSNNGISVANDVWKAMPNLERLYMEYNNLESFPDLNAFTTLQQLYLKGNSLTNVGNLSILEQNVDLWKIHLQHNDFTTVDNMLKVADSLTSSGLRVHLNGNDMECNVDMCWMKHMSL